MTNNPGAGDEPRHYTVTSVRLDVENYQATRLKLMANKLGTFSDFVNAKMIEFLTTPE